MNIREAVEGDLDGLVALLEQLDEHVAGSNPRLWPAEGRRREALLKTLRDDAACVLVAEADGELIGYMAGRVGRWESGPPHVIGHLLWAFVCEEWRSRGAGRALVDRLLGFFESRGVEDITLRYVIGNAHAERFWAMLGFTPLICIANVRPEELRDKLGRMG